MSPTLKKSLCSVPQYEDIKKKSWTVRISQTGSPSLSSEDYKRPKSRRINHGFGVGIFLIALHENIFR